MNRSILLLARIDEDIISNHGIVEKLNGQAKAHETLGWTVDIITNKAQCIYFNNEEVIDKRTSLSLLFAYKWFEWVQQKVLDQPYDILWIRYGLSTPAFIRFLKAYKAKHPKVKIVIDMPTYPYQQEWIGFKGRIILAMDHHYAKQLQAYVDLVLHSGPETEIFNIPTFYMTNGVDIPKSPRIDEKVERGEINLLAIGKWQYWHGLDRVVNALQKDIGMHLHIVGTGPALEQIEKGVQQKDLKDIVHFHGPLVGAQLQKLIMQCHIGVGTLGIHRKSIRNNSSLKHRTYCAAGLPFFYAGTDSDFADNCVFAYVCPENDQVIDLNKIKRFYQELLPLGNIHMKMIEHAEKYLSWTTRVKQIHDKIF